MQEDAPTITIRQLRPGDEPGLLAHLRSVFGVWPAHDVPDALEHLHWKIDNDPRARGLHVVAEAAGAIVGSMLCMVRQVKVRDVELVGQQAADIAVEPEHQQRGLVQRMQAYAYPLWRDTCDLFYGRPRHPAFKRLHGRWTLESKSLPFGNAPGTLECALPAAGRAPAVPSRWQIRRVETFDERFEAFWREASRAFDLIVVRTPAYLNWRYMDRRSGHSVVIVAEDGERVLGYAVLRFARGMAFLADLLALPRRTDVVRALVEASLLQAREGASVLRCRLPGRHPYRRVLREFGFASRRRETGAIYGTFGPARPELAFLQEPSTAVHITFGDADWV